MSFFGTVALTSLEANLSNKRVLVVEDSEVKWREISKLLSSGNSLGVFVQRAATMEEANGHISSGNWDLILLDISMDIRSSATGPRAGGHDTIGGLKIAERMFYLGKDAPVIIVTAFDAFPSGAARGSAVLGLEDVVRSASDLLGELLIGYVRYGSEGWSRALRDLVDGVLKA
jgi:CheY-like chemotaxis protein